MSEEGNRSYYTHNNSNDSSNSDEDNLEIKLLMAYENNDVEKEEVTILKAQLECDFKVRQMLQDEVISLKNKQKEELPQVDKEQENEILKLRQQVEEGIKAA